MPQDVRCSERRKPTDLSSLLIEWMRALKGLSYYATTDPQRLALVDRVWRVTEGDLARFGDLELAWDATGLLAGDLAGGSLPFREASELNSRFEEHHIEKLRVHREITFDALHALLDLLAQRADANPAEAQGFLRALAARDASGIEVNGESAPAHWSRPSLSSTAPTAAASIANPVLAPARSSAESPTQPVGPAGPDAGPEGHGETHGARDPEEKPSLDEAPLRAEPGDELGARLRARLVELDGMVDDGQYELLAGDVAIWTEELTGLGHADECYRALLVFADHAVGSGGRSESQARIATACFESLATGARLDDLIDRAARGSSAGRIRAAQLLLQLGESIAPALFERIAASNDDDQIASLTPLVLSLGEAALPTLVSAIESNDDVRARRAIRLAGELQSPLVLPTLVRAMAARDPARRLDTIRALSLLPGDDSKEALETALSSDLDEIVVAAMGALAQTGGNQVVPSLLDVLDASLHSHRTKVSCELVGALERIGDERAIPRLSAILERRPVLRRAHWHAIQLAAIDALAVLPRKEARRSIERCARGGPRALRKRARQLISDTEKPG